MIPHVIMRSFNSTYKPVIYRRIFFILKTAKNAAQSGVPNNPGNLKNTLLDRDLYKENDGYEFYFLTMANHKLSTRLTHCSINQN